MFNEKTQTVEANFQTRLADKHCEMILGAPNVHNRVDVVIFECNIHHTVHTVSGMQKTTSVPNSMHKIESTLVKSIEKEIKGLSSSERSPFKVSSVEDVKKLSFSKQKEEVIKKYAPLLWKLFNTTVKKRGVYRTSHTYRIRNTTTLIQYLHEHECYN